LRVTYKECAVNEAEKEMNKSWGEVAKENEEEPHQEWGQLMEDKEKEKNTKSQWMMFGF
jgi:hypothetical protein